MNPYASTFEIVKGKVVTLPVAIKGVHVKSVEPMGLNPKWFLVSTSNGSRYWIHPDSGTVVTIVEK